MLIIEFKGPEARRSLTTSQTTELFSQNSIIIKSCYQTLHLVLRSEKN